MTGIGVAAPSRMHNDPPFPRPGDLLISKPTASTVHELTIVPSGECVLRGRREPTVTAGLELAQQLGVDVWLTLDYIHFMLLSAPRYSG